MFSVGKLGGFISKGVYTISGPFHPFGGAVDIIVVEQPDGSYKSSPWHVRFGKFQGVLKASERIVGINVNGVDANFNMYLDNRGEAFFLHDADVEEGESNSEVYPSFGNVVGSKQGESESFEGSDGEIKPGIGSPRARIFGLSFGRRSMKKNEFHESESGVGIDRTSSLERAQIAADLLEVRWTTNLKTISNGNIDSLGVISTDLPLDGVVDDVKFENGSSVDNSQFNGLDESAVDYSSMPHQGTVSSDASGCQSSCNISDDNLQAIVLEKSYIRFENGASKSDENLQNNLSEFTKLNVRVSCALDTDNNSLVSFGEEQSSICTECASRDSLILGEHEDEMKDHLSGRWSEPESSIHPSGMDKKEISSDDDSFNGGANLLSDIHCKMEVNEVISIIEKNAYAALSETPDEQLTCISGLDDPKVGKVVGIEVLSPDSIKDALIESSMRDDKSNELSGSHLGDHSSPREKSVNETRPAEISEDHRNDDSELLAPVVESFPTMPLTGDNVGPYDIMEQRSCSLNPNSEALKLVNNGVQEPVDAEAEQYVEHVKIVNNSTQISDEIKRHISDPAVEVSLCRHLLYEGMGYEEAAVAFNAEKLDKEKFLSFCPDIVKDDKLVVRIGGLYFPWDAALPIAAAIGSPEEQILEPKGMIVVGQANEVSKEVLTKPKYTRNGSWRNFSFSFKRSNSVRENNFEADMGRNADDDGTTGKKKKIWAKSPTSEQLASLKLKEGKNVVIFTFSTAMLGNQQVDARIFLWKWNTKIVISDVDGTITKSDVLGQFMPMMGIDWSHTGVAHLFSAVKENGYYFLFLSARSISQAYQTRQFLVNLKQDGKTLPDGPIVISPDGLFPSLYREVIRRAPHEFKISCLEEIKALFPRDHNPFYAGFGNRHTDEISYLKVGIPKGKIFTINPKGEVVVNRTVDTKSYVSLHMLVHNMFPSTTRTEEEGYNSWNFWRLPPPDVSV